MVQKLRSISDPKARAAAAITQLDRRQRRDTQLAALDALIASPRDEARVPLLELYHFYAENGPKRDPGAYMRHAILRALRPLATPEDVPLLLDAVSTYERLPPGFQEEAKLLRSGALIILNELDDELAGYHAVRLLVDGEAEPMSGEPALTAAKVLATLNQPLPLYQYAMRTANDGLPEVVAECLRSLTSLPPALVPGIVDHFEETADNVIRIGLVDLLISHEAGPLALDYLAISLATTADPDLYRYLLISLLSARRADLNRLVIEAAEAEFSRAKLSVLAETLELFGADPEIGALKKALAQRLA